MNVIARPREQSGLFVEGTDKRVPLEGVRVHARIAGRASRVTMSQRFRNAEDIPIEAVYRSWSFEPALFEALGVERGPLMSAARELGDSDAEPIVATLAALRFLETRAADARGEWRLLADKAERWLQAAFAKRPSGARAEAERLVAACWT